MLAGAQIVLSLLATQLSKDTGLSSMGLRAIVANRR